MPHDLYDHDVLAWSEHQAGLLRRLAAGERLNEAVDWANVIEEVESVGRSDFNACETLLEQALVHLIKLHAWPGSLAARHWRPEIVAFLSQAGRRFSPSMRQRIDLTSLYAGAMKQFRNTVDDAGEPQSVPADCPYTLDELFNCEIAELVAKLTPRPVP